jgi:hypothetical protein
MTARPAQLSTASAAAAPVLTDAAGRPLRDLRISVTDRCNFRCVYCMPKEVFGNDYVFLERKELLTFEEIARVARVFRGLGIEKARSHVDDQRLVSRAQSSRASGSGTPTRDHQPRRPR